MDVELKRQMLEEAIGRGEVDEKILPLVKALWQAGITTASSCEGHIDIDRCCSSYPFILIGFWYSPEEIPNEILKKLFLLLGLWNGGTEPMTSRQEWILVPRWVIKMDK